MAFMQLIEFETDNYDEIKKLEDEYFTATAGKRTVRNSYVGRDRANPNKYVVAVLFDSYEAAMENSNLPETGEFAAKQQAVATNVSFRDLDVIDERS
jgi:hypothetical protein